MLSVGRWKRQGRPCAIQREQAPTKLMDRRAKTQCQSREEWGRHEPNRGAKRTFSEDHARTSHPAGHCRVEAPVEQGSEWVTVTVTKDYEF